MAISAALRKKVWQRASGHCEHCRVPVEYDALPACVDHIIALKHLGLTEFGNLALTCYHCNSFKGDNIAGVDPQNTQLTSLFNPRRDNWSFHFSWQRGLIDGKTPTGRVTIYVLNLNDPDRVLLRELLAEAQLMRLSKPDSP